MASRIIRRCANFMGWRTLQVRGTPWFEGVWLKDLAAMAATRGKEQAAKGIP